MTYPADARAVERATLETAVALYFKLYLASGEDPDTFAARSVVRNRRLCAMVLDVIGEWPSSEPELRALQKQRIWP